MTLFAQSELAASIFCGYVVTKQLFLRASLRLLERILPPAQPLVLHHLPGCHLALLLPRLSAWELTIATQSRLRLRVPQYGQQQLRL